MGQKKVKAQVLDPNQFQIKQEAELAKQQSQQQFELAKQRQEFALAEQKKLMEQLGAQARGEAPSLAEAQLRSATNRNLAQQLAAAAAQRGGSQAATQRQLLRQQGEAGRQLAEQAGQARLQEAQGAQALQANVLGAEVGRADTGTQAGIGSQFQYATAPQTQNLALAQFNAAQQQQANATNAQNQAAMTGGLLNAGGTVGAALLSDADKKTNKENAKKQTKELLDKLSAKKFKYKDGVKGEESDKENFGVMAQDLEKSEMGKSLVVETPQGKAVDTRKGFGALLAAQAELNRRLSKLEKKRGGSRG